MILFSPLFFSQAYGNMLVDDSDRLATFWSVFIFGKVNQVLSNLFIFMSSMKEIEVQLLNKSYSILQFF